MRERRYSRCRNLRPLKRRLWLHYGKHRKACTLLLLLLIQVLGFLAYELSAKNVRYTRTGPAMDSNGAQIIFFGETQPRDAAALGGLTTAVRKYTPAELEAEYGDMDFIYTFVNGTERDHAFRRLLYHRCLNEIMHAEEVFYTRRKVLVLPCTKRGFFPRAETVRGLLKKMGGAAARAPSARDRERDELRYSIRSVEQHIRWHRGRLIIVSPGHYPSWVDQAKNFMWSALTSNLGPHMRGRHARITTVHQDALMPYGMRLTVDSHTIEMQLFRVRNITPIHLFLNDDYFINGEVEVNHLLNENGGTYVRTEHGMLQKAVNGANGTSWSDGVRHTNLFNTMELDIHKEDHLPHNILERWQAAGYDPAYNIPVASGDQLIHTARDHPPNTLPKKATPQRPRFYATHAPFVYCTRMFEFLNTRYELEIAHNTLQHRGRMARDLFTPFVYNAFIMARPWQSSPRFLPYLTALQLNRMKNLGVPKPPPLHILLDNKDACAPATLLRQPASEAMYAKFVDNLEKNKRVIHSLEMNKPLFFNINDEFREVNSSLQLQVFLASVFQKPALLERTAAETNDSAPYFTAFQELMKLPLVIFASYREALCPLIRSLKLAMPQFTGQVILVLEEGTAEENKDNLETMRQRLNHRVISAMPVVLCTFSGNVKEVTVSPKLQISEAVQQALGTVPNSTKTPVLLPEDYIGGSQVKVAALAIDARTRHLLDSVAALTRAIEVPAQSLALEDFELAAPTDSNGSVLVLSREDAKRKAIHWVNGASETDLLITFPLPYARYEDLDAPITWSFRK
ncbi:putative ATP-dependent chaperone [Trypanosoma rangeli]|uniref:Putative ATP-dependent chaperone n=1 Tax=Trypanosoma rangeli TaxID=5698 RepID=A0A422NAR5_TRYRA|nr:putative ATP-dependent chaperone [Trypanosoma rangeli]RNF02551.1 putative ATP-dependent chaperone [Trypanosoma rangeli]|eukprot:RNF02551.1 putative ATP-dependent chaperone [Trypanosoma rangeli]